MLQIREQPKEKEQENHSLNLRRIDDRFKATTKYSAPVSILLHHCAEECKIRLPDGRLWVST
jgi:hypothetical protein